MTNNVEFSILDTVMARLIKKSPFADPILGLEIIQGEWKGIVFSFKKFEMMPMQMENGMVPTRYETEIHIRPDHLKHWEPDDAFDRYTTEVLMAWLSYIHQNDLSPLIKASTTGSIN